MFDRWSESVQCISSGEIKSFYAAEMNKMHMTSRMRTRDIRHCNAIASLVTGQSISHLSHEQLESVSR